MSEAHWNSLYNGIASLFLLGLTSQSYNYPGEGICMECLTCIPFTIKFDLRLVVVRSAVKFVASTTSPMKKGLAISTL